MNGFISKCLTKSYRFTWVCLQSTSLQLVDGQFGGGHKSLYEISFGGKVPVSDSPSYIRPGLRVLSRFFWSKLVFPYESERISFLFTVNVEHFRRRIYFIFADALIFAEVVGTDPGDIQSHGWLVAARERWKNHNKFWFEEQLSLTLIHVRRTRRWKFLFGICHFDPVSGCLPFASNI